MVAQQRVLFSKWMFSPCCFSPEIFYRHFAASLKMYWLLLQLSFAWQTQNRKLLGPIHRMGCNKRLFSHFTEESDKAQPYEHLTGKLATVLPPPPKKNRKSPTAKEKSVKDWCPASNHFVAHEIIWDFCRWIWIWEEMGPTLRNQDEQVMVLGLKGQWQTWLEVQERGVNGTNGGRAFPPMLLDVSANVTARGVLFQDDCLHNINAYTHRQD